MCKASYEETLTLYQDYLNNCHRLLEFTQLFAQQFSQETGAEDVNNFTQQREQHFAKLQECQLLITQISKNEQNGSLSEEEQEKLDRTTNSIKTCMEKIVEQDELISTSFGMDLERIKLELHRWQRLRRVKDTYRGSTAREARFIDKNK
jgi:hypothetical protein